MKLNFEVLYWEPSTLEGREIEIMKNFKGEYEECLKFIENNKLVIFDGPYEIDRLSIPMNLQLLAHTLHAQSAIKG